MSARTKLNGIAFGAVLGFAALVGGVTSSWLVFVVVTILGAILMLHAGEVRLKPDDRTYGSRSHGHKHHSR